MVYGHLAWNVDCLTRASLLWLWDFSGDVKVLVLTLDCKPLQMRTDAKLHLEKVHLEPHLA